ncbi:MAG: ABC1 kinase family protein [Halobacteria archaeon]
MSRIRTAKRFLLISYHLTPLLWSFARDRKRYLFFGESREVTDEIREKRADRLLESFLRLGPTFIKLGQVVSTRPDALPSIYTDKMSHLQDEVPPADWEKIEFVIEEDVGPVSEFGEFDKQPISGASLGQVYAASRDGQKLAVKVRRPGVEKLVQTDLAVMETVLPFILRFAKPGQRFTLENLADQFDHAIREEMDYVHERRMMEEINRNLSDMDDVVIPEVVEDLSGERVITMEYVAGTKITDVDELERHGVDPTALTRRIQRIYVEMILGDGLFHADPHPGNLSVLDDGTLVMYDFGRVGRLDREMRRYMFDFYVAVSREDYDNMINSFIDMGALEPDVDRRIMRKMFAITVDDMKGKDIQDKRVEEMIEDMQENMYEFPVRIPTQLAMLFRTTTLLGGVCYTLDEDFDFTTVVKNYIVQNRYGNIWAVARTLRKPYEKITSIAEMVTAVRQGFLEIIKPG